MGSTSMKTWYVIDEDDDELTVVEAASAKEALEAVFGDIVDDPNMEPFTVCIFPASAAKRYEVRPNVQISMELEELD